MAGRLLIRTPDYVGEVIKPVSEWVSPNYAWIRFAEARRPHRLGSLDEFERAFDKTASLYLERKGKNGFSRDYSFSLVIVDGNGIGNVGRKYGPEAGTEAVLNIGTAIKAGLKDGDSGYQTCGDEFSVVLRRGPEAAGEFVKELKSRLSETPVFSEGLPLDYRVTVGAGSISLPELEVVAGAHNTYETSIIPGNLGSNVLDFYMTLPGSAAGSNHASLEDLVALARRSQEAGDRESLKYVLTKAAYMNMSIDKISRKG